MFIFSQIVRSNSQEVILTCLELFCYLGDEQRHPILTFSTVVQEPGVAQAKPVVPYDPVKPNGVSVMIENLP